MYNFRPLKESGNVYINVGIDTAGRTSILSVWLTLDKARSDKDKRIKDTTSPFVQIETQVWMAHS